MFLSFGVFAACSDSAPVPTEVDETSEVSADVTGGDVPAAAEVDAVELSDTIPADEPEDTAADLADPDTATTPDSTDVPNTSDTAAPPDVTDTPETVDLTDTLADLADDSTPRDISAPEVTDTAGGVDTHEPDPVQVTGAMELRGHLGPDAIVDLAVIDDERAFALTARSLYRRDGQGWSRVAAVQMPSPAAMWVASDDDIWVVGANEAVARWSGQSWTPDVFDAIGTRDNRGIWGIAPDEIYIAAGPDLYHWNGTLWTHQETVAPPGSEYSPVAQG